MKKLFNFPFANKRDKLILIFDTHRDKGFKTLRLCRSSIKDGLTLSIDLCGNVPTNVRELL